MNTKKIRQMEELLMVHKEFGEPNMHRGGFYRTLNQSLVVCVEVLSAKRGGAPQNMEELIEMMRPQSTEQDADGAKEYGMIVVKSSDPRFKQGMAYVVDTEGSAEWLDIQPIYEVELKFEQIKFNDSLPEPVLPSEGGKDSEDTTDNTGKEDE
jgi:hypothetical protein